MGPIIDWWAIPHVAFGIVVASAIHAKWEPRGWVHLLLWIGSSYAWELGEHFLQRAYPETWVVLEHPLNAWLIDPTSNGVGWIVGFLIARWSKGRKR